MIREIRRSGALGRGELVRRTALPRSSVFAIVGDLVERGVLVETSRPGDARRGRGRPGALVSLDPAAGLIVGVDVGREATRLVVANAAHQIVAAGVSEEPAAEDAGACAVQIETLIHSVCAVDDIDLDALEAVGIGVYGLPEIHESATRSPRDLTSELSNRLEVPVALGNNTRLAALAEATWGAGRGVDDQVYVRWSVGVGGGCLVGGRLLVGANGAAGEIGHVCLDPNGPRCDCGGHGCLETLVGGPALLEICRQRGLDLRSLDDLVEAVQARIAVASDVVVQAARRLGVVLAGTVALLDPQRVIIGGELGQVGSLVLEAIHEKIDALSMPGLGRTVEVVRADLGMNDGALGAVAHVLRSRQPTTTAG
ncbi:ROK family transcriptional regulator [Leekyejoonella antrihumi]|uniref:ROK family transcriptional regulator n=1 Tax=Leekyejoonella antrihumi TaxID=1660198 RepID=A0A563DVL0_9MICO|nr:ROK family transcriptional regulator [Leekyejoonella antrihumi]